MTGALALVAALTISSQLQTHPTGLPSVGPSRANSLRTAPIMDKLYEQAGKPALDFDFARYKDLHDNASGKTSLITFSRSAAQSPGTYVGSDGLIKTAAVNLALYSEQFDNAAWVKSNATVKANQIVAPDGKQTADKIEENGATGVHRIDDTASVVTGGVYTLSVYFKAAERDRVLVRTYDGGANLSVACKDDGTIANIEGTPEASTNEDVGNGWRRCSLTYVVASGTTGYMRIGPIDDGSSASYAGTDGNGVYIWGAQLEETDPATMAPTPYIKTTSQTLAAPRFDHDPVTGESLGLLVEEARTNYWKNSGDPDAASWLLFGVTRRTTAPIAAPDGTSVSTVFDFSSSADRAVFQTYTAVTGYHTLSAWVRTESGSDTIYLTMNPGTGDTYSSPFSVNEQWQRITFTLNFTGSGHSANPAIRNGSTSGNDPSVYIWGVQLEKDAPFVTSYIPNPTTGSQTRYADIAAVQDEDFATTNLLSYSESFDVGWTTSGLQPITANATTAPNGQTTADYLQEDTSTGNHYVRYVPSVTSGATYTFSVYAKKAERSAIQFDFSTGVFGSQSWANYDLDNGALGTTGTSGSASITDVGGGWYLCTRTVTALSSGGVNFLIQISDSASASRGASYTGDGTSGIYLWGASLTATEHPVTYTTTRNLLTDSQDFERSTWNKRASSPTTVLSYDVTQAPDGTNSATELSQQYIYRQESVLSGASYVTSMYIKNNGAASVRLYSQIEGGGSYRNALIDTSNFTVISSTFSNAPLIVDVGNGWHRVSIVELSPSSGTRNLQYWELTAGAGSVYLWGAQLEPGSTATDYVRTVDVVGKDYQWYEPTEGTVFVEANDFPGNLYSRLFFLGESTANQVLQVYNSSVTDWTYLKSSDGSPVTIGSSVAPYRISTAYQLDDYGSAINGAAGGSDTSTNGLADSSQLIFGRRDSTTATFLNGHIRRLTYWPRRQSDSTLQVITQ